MKQADAEHPVHGAIIRYVDSDPALRHVLRTDVEESQSFRVIEWTLMRVDMILEQLKVSAENRRIVANYVVKDSIDVEAAARRASELAKRAVEMETWPVRGRLLPDGSIEMLGPE